MLIEKTNKDSQNKEININIKTKIQKINEPNEQITGK